LQSAAIRCAKTCAISSDILTFSPANLQGFVGFCQDVRFETEARVPQYYKLMAGLFQMSVCWKLLETSLKKQLLFALLR
jgi:hypothetical protein